LPVNQLGANSGDSCPPNLLLHEQICENELIALKDQDADKVRIQSAQVKEAQFPSLYIEDNLIVLGLHLGNVPVRICQCPAMFGHQFQSSIGQPDLALSGSNWGKIKFQSTFQ
jgi:hypothetical protein